MNQIKSIERINNAELEQGILSPEKSWHEEYRNQAYIFVGGLNRELTEADILTVFSQYGSPVDLKLVRDKETGSSKGFAYLKYEDQRSTILAIDNLNGVRIAGRVIKVDHAFYEPREDDWEYMEAMSQELAKDKVQTPANLRVKDATKVEKEKKEEDELADPMVNK